MASNLRLSNAANPPNIGELEAAVNEARAMLELPQNWAEEGNPRFLESTWQRAADFVLESAAHLWQTLGRTVPVPQLQPVGDGSIDIAWECDGRTLIVNVPADCQEPATYYGRYDGRRYTTKGTLDTSANNEWLLMWLRP